ncbi:MAG: histidine kinase N-terminal 7TM domain-containing protein, partial [Pygmaiobacter sp.]
MSLNDKLYVFVPLASLLCNVFLFLSCVSAKKTRVIYAFMELLTVFMAWTGGSLFMRLQLYPDALFWYEVSIFGIFLVPYAVYNFIYYFCDSRGTFVKRIVLACWIAITGLNLMHVFIKDPRVLVENGEHTFTFTVSWIIVFPIVLAVLTFAMAWRVVYKSVKEDHISIDHLRPLLIGVAIMFVGTILD